MTRKVLLLVPAVNLDSFQEAQLSERCLEVVLFFTLIYHIHFISADVTVLKLLS
jgi:hypothetical protein